MEKTDSGMKRSVVIAFTGPESSGKSTLSKKIAEDFDAFYSPEYAREYLEERNGEYSYEDLEVIAKEQSKRWFSGILQAAPLMILDTELTTIKIWSEVRFGKTSEWLEEHYLNQNIDLYVLCKPDLKWQDDPLRESPSIEEREDLFRLYKNELEELNRPYAIVSGEGDQRLEMTRKIIREFLSTK